MNKRYRILLMRWKLYKRDNENARNKNHNIRDKEIFQ